MRTKLLLLLALALVGCKSQSVIDMGTPCYPKTSPQITTEDGQTWVCAYAQTWTPEAAGSSNLDKKAERREAPPILRRFLLLLFSMVLFFWSVDYGERFGIGERFTIFAYCAFALSGLLFVFTDIPATWGWWL